MDKQEMIDKIYEKVADKESVRRICCPECKGKVKYDRDDYIYSNGHKIDTTIYGCDSCNLENIENDLDYKDFEEDKPIMIGDILDWIKNNKDSIEGKLNSCPRCGSSIGFEEGQQSFPETGQWDFPDSHFCKDNNNTECDWDTRYGKEDFFLTEIGCVTDELIGVYSGELIWEELRKPIESQNIECIEYIYNLVK